MPEEAHLTVDRLDQMTPEEERLFWLTFERQIAFDDDRAAQEHLAAGRPIYYSNNQYGDEIIREWPDGRLQLVEVDARGNITVKRDL